MSKNLILGISLFFTTVISLGVYVYVVRIPAPAIDEVPLVVDSSTTTATSNRPTTVEEKMKILEDLDTVRAISEGEVRADTQEKLDVLNQLSSEDSTVHDTQVLDTVISNSIPDKSAEEKLKILESLNQ